MNPDWSVCMRSGITAIRRLAIVLAYIFTSRFSKEIGRKFWREVGALPGFGMVIIRAFSDSSVNFEEEAAMLKNSVKWGSKCLENFL